mmetsp:Transcript_30460/g.5507  ORF Transcript_30460/g.5507 Transcript_30460/m.5507 type:complete len:105 (+) Transcript_30460:2-316(+)
MYCIDRVIEGVYVGNEPAAKRRAILKQNGITHILIAGCNLHAHYPQNFTYKIINVHDTSSTNIQQHFDDCNQFIDQALSQNGRVFIHCYQGISRSSTIMIAFLM